MPSMQFALVNISRTINAQWYGMAPLSSAEATAKAQQRKGNYRGECVGSRPLCTEARERGTVLCETMGDPIKQSKKLIPEPIKRRMNLALRKDI